MSYILGGGYGWYFYTAIIVPHNKPFTGATTCSLLRWISTNCQGYFQQTYRFKISNVVFDENSRECELILIIDKSLKKLVLTTTKNSLIANETNLENSSTSVLRIF